MNLDELQSVQARERQSSDLQHLRSSFYREVGEYIDELTDRRSALVAEVDKPFSSPEVRQLSDDIETAEQTVEAIYERRVGKVVKKASIAAAGMPVDDDGLTAEEEALFEALVDRIERNRETVLSVLEGEAPVVSDDERTGAGGIPEHHDSGEAGSEDDGVEPGGVDAADVMGGGGDEDAADTGTEAAAGEPGDSGTPERDGSPTDVPPDTAPPEAASSDAAPPDATPTGGDGPDDASGTDGDQGSPAERATEDGPTSGTVDGPTDGDEATSGSGDDPDDVPGVPRTTVRITADVGEVVGADNRDYDLGPEDVVTLPEANADVLVEKDAAERLE